MQTKLQRLLLFGHRYSVGPQKFRQILSRSLKEPSSVSSKRGKEASKTLLVEYGSMLAQHMHALALCGAKAGEQRNASSNSPKK